MLFFASCSKAPTVENIRQLEVIGVQKGVVAIEIQCDVNNPNIFGLTILNSDFEFSYNEVKLGEFRFEDDFKVSAGGSTAMEVEADLYLDKLHENFPGLVSAGEAEVEVNGDVDYKVSFIAGNAKVEETFLLDYFKALKELLDQAMNKPGGNELSKLSLADNSTLLKPVLQYDYVVSNDFGVPFTLRNVDLQFKMDDAKKDLANWKLSDSIYVAEYDTAIVPMKLGLSTAELSRNVLSGGFFGKDDKEEEKEDLLKVLGTIKVDVEGHEFSIPIEYERKIDLKELGLF